jgi:hypothetical protein
MKIKNDLFMELWWLYYIENKRVFHHVIIIIFVLTPWIEKLGFYLSIYHARFGIKKIKYIAAINTLFNLHVRVVIATQCIINELFDIFSNFCIFSVAKNPNLAVKSLIKWFTILIILTRTIVWKCLKCSFITFVYLWFNR